MLDQVEVSLDDTQIIEQLKADSFYDVFMAQLRRLEENPNRAPNTIIAGKIPGQGVTRYVQYHFMPGDQGFSMVSVYSTDQALLKYVERSLVCSYGDKIKVLYVDDPGRRN